jgi:hypothetical protein
MGVGPSLAALAGLISAHLTSNGLKGLV